MKKLKQQGTLGIIEIIVILIIILAIGLVGLLVMRKSESLKSNQSKQSPLPPQASVTGVDEIDKMLAGVQYTKISSAPASVCSDERKVCYEGATVLVKMSYPVPEKFKKIVANLNQHKWLLEDGRPVSALLESDTIATSDLHPNNVPDKDLLFTEPDAERHYSYFSLLNLGLFGVKETMFRGNEGAYFFAFSKSELQSNEEPYYIMESEVPGAKLFNFKGVMAQIDDNTFILSVTFGKESVD